MSIRNTPCNWPVSYAGCQVPQGQTKPQVLTNLGVQAAAFESMATELLWRWTGQAFGICQEIVRPCRANCNGSGMSSFWGGGPVAGMGSGPWRPVIINGLWYNVGWGCGSGMCQDNCGCDNADMIRLNGPIDSINSIVIDGQVLSPSAYRVDNNQLVTRLDGVLWPTCQNLGSPSASGVGAKGTWQIDYNIGTPVPLGGQLAAGVLATELAKMSCNDKTCGLPQRVQTISRQGVTVAMIDNFDNLMKGQTGIWSIDSWVASIMHSPKRSGIASPDFKRDKPRRQTWP